MKTVNITGDNRAEQLAELRAGIGKEIIVRYPDGHTESGVLRVVTDDYIEFDPPIDENEDDWESRDDGWDAYTGPH